jgi:hypothetical protein
MPRIDNKFSQAAKISLVRRRLSVTRLAAQIERPRQTVSAIINGSTRYPLLRAEIAKLLKCAA